MWLQRTHMTASFWIILHFLSLSIVFSLSKTANQTIISTLNGAIPFHMLEKACWDSFTPMCFQEIVEMKDLTEYLHTEHPHKVMLAIKHPTILKQVFAPIQRTSVSIGNSISKNARPKTYTQKWLCFLGRKWNRALETVSWDKYHLSTYLPKIRFYFRPPPSPIIYSW